MVRQFKKKVIMIVLIERRQTSLFIKDDKGMHLRLVFAEMEDAVARRLVREYGFRQEWVYGIIHETVAYRHEVDDNAVQEVLARLPYLDRRRESDVLQAVQTIVPQAVRIVRMRGGIAKGVKYED